MLVRLTIIYWPTNRYTKQLPPKRLIYYYPSTEIKNHALLMKNYLIIMNSLNIYKTNIGEGRRLQKPKIPLISLSFVFQPPRDPYFPFVSSGFDICNLFMVPWYNRVVMKPHRIISSPIFNFIWFNSTKHSMDF